MGPKAVVGQQTYEAPPSNSDVAGLSGGIRAAGPRAMKPGKITEDFVIISTTQFECIRPEAEHVHDLVHVHLANSFRYVGYYCLCSSIYSITPFLSTQPPDQSCPLCWTSQGPPAPSLRGQG